MIALGVALTPAYARLMYGQVLTVKQNDYILAEKAIGSRGTTSCCVICCPTACRRSWW